MRPRSLTAKPCCFAQARISPERWRPAGMLKVGHELLAERRGVFGVQADLIVGAVEREPDGLFGRAAGQVVFENDAFWALLPSRRQRCLHRTVGTLV
jgi:hypothetical protein